MGNKSFLLIILLVLVASVTYAQVPEKIYVGDAKKIYKLTGEWKFNHIDKMGYASPDYDDSGWERISVPGQWHMLGIKDVETAWYRRNVFINKDLIKTPISIRTPIIADAHEFYFNGKKVGGVGDISPDGKIIKKSSLTAIYAIPSEIINYDGDNVIAIRVCDNVGWGGFVTSSFFIGSAKKLTRQFQRHIIWNASISFVLIFLGAYYLILFLSRLKEVVYFFYSLLSTAAGLGLFGSTSLTYIIIDNFWFTHFIFHSGLNILPLFGIVFIYSYFEYDRDLIYKIFTTIYILLFSVVLMTPLHLSILKLYGNVTLTVSIVLDMVVMAWIMFLVIKSVKMKKMGANIIGIGSLLCILALANDLLGYLNILPTRRFASEGFALFIISISVDMALKYARLYDALQAAQEKIIEKEKMEHEIKLAAEVQRSLLPDDLPQYPSYSVDAYLEPARMVGGDFYDVVRIDDEHLGILVGDVADKGLHAAMFMAVTRTLFYCEIRNSLSPAHVAKAVHRHIMDVAPSNENFVTAFYGVLHCPTGLLTYVRAGHELPLLFRPGQPVTTIMSKGRFLGMFDDLDLKEYTFKFQSGDKLVLYSDGVPEANNLDGHQFGNTRFMECLEKNGDLSASMLVRQIVETTGSWMRGTAPFDDLTLLVVEAK
ncbi:MAG: SpoIIE family protein phosphatase [Deltaproteobacteria bacterium]|nr:SpoIIE family protein phosphatase [Deltaproteobacteria bacterium]MBL7175258.1 SpoIIE family protein phosphatase [Desulfobacteraceae bacterium]